MLKIVLCDDNRHSNKEYAELISEIAKKNQLEIVISCFESGESLLFHYSDTIDQIDILYLDIIMNETNGMETAQKLRDYGCKAQIIFLTSFEDYVYEAFDVNAVQYLLKDNTSYEKFELVFLKAVKLASIRTKELFTFEFDGETGVIPIDQISYFEIWQRLITIHYDNGKIAKFYDSIEHLEQRLRKNDFVRSHRSFLVHLPYIAMFGHQSLRLKTGEVVPVGGTYIQTLKRAFSDYIARFQVYGSESFRSKEWG
ncbi:LytTR family two component transcriptional regulator [Hungatella effluvii]|uniref:Stage 0 sporulation protein A homolog n=1 Tax=Hungatella effluvii TaxID=1096246 RepID=A0A2V3XZ44_9FIRM|nr:LytTR family DNA-binding domain-containing protein [Hungatella effluvii]PXX49226.1 LytTR family two component transcriptional regulator [Hungatella effluvii]